ncbi:phospholipase D-like domain-containing protein [Oxynema aestuarii]|uniref:phospholipase D n=1 Tax=Oxynema aestuarii AP17 TaxID=2064643 RepID=A0A6H1TVF7_9CYAN|nr:phospholipase D-like domain-containing protein [Oxynema aestuarii]QIZ69733.1 DUF1669 domain-containing protein [Oxynema aestuarii AP17]
MIDRAKSIPLWGQLAILSPLFLLSACWTRPPLERLTRSVPPLPQDPAVQVYFNHNPAAEYREPYRDFRRQGDNLEQVIVEAIASAQTQIDLAVQEFRLPEIARALVERHRAGVRVRVIIENTYNRPWSDLSAAEVAGLDERDRGRYEEFRQLVDRDDDGTLSPEEIATGDALVILRDAGIEVLDNTADGSKGSGLMHHKFVVVDGRTTIATSANFTTSGIHGDFADPSSRGNPNNLLKIDSPELAAAFAEEFELMWGDGPGGQSDSRFGINKPWRDDRTFQVGETTISVHFAPSSSRVPWEESVNGTIGATLGNADRAIDLALFVFSVQELADILETRHRAGVLVRLLVDPSFAYRSYSESLDLLGVALPDDRCRVEAFNRPWSEAIATVGVPQLAPGDRLHHKFALIDNTTAIAGSHNWSVSANTQNDETLLVLTNPTVAAHFQREFDRLYDNALLGLSPKQQERIEAAIARCGADSQAAAPTVAPQINVNLATAAELETLPGIGPTLAARIVAARREGPFTSLSDLDRVPGIGPKMLERLGDRVTF